MYGRLTSRRYLRGLVLRGRITRRGRASGKKSQKMWIPKYSSVTRLHTLRLVCFEGMLRDLIPYDQCHLVPPRQPLPLLPLPLLAECRSLNMAGPHWTRETWNIERVARARVVVHGKGADSVAGYPFISDVKIQTCLEQEWSEVTLVQGRDSNMEVTGERSLGRNIVGKINVNNPLGVTA